MNQREEHMKKNFDYFQYKNEYCKQLERKK